ncbi:hypothetical protein GBK04_28745 [Cytophagaceae bacterium SJW1-29]|uniref:DUF3828 domain-containing protein n=2 Tax=Salmonirosea aquatica TaxID=2654236 RepID=A0A7C9BMC7_9BACT|nr:hypothetical protein [Cytophagaceae bacterium SJW1-29]
MPQLDLVADSAVSTDTRQARQTVVRFLTWYKNHIQEANRIPLVNQTAGKPYSVNLKNGERYLTYLKSSHRLTDAYLNQWRVFFRERQAGFRQSPQFEGPPTGFDYDLVMLTQDVDTQLDSLKSLKMGKVTILGDQATVGFTLLDVYEFRLVRQNRRWLIDEILNQSQE